MAETRKLLAKSKGKQIFYECSECGWYFDHSTQIDAPTGQTEEQVRQIFGAQRDESFAAHECAKFPKPKSGAV